MSLTRGTVVVLIMAVTSVMFLALAAVLAVNGFVVPVDQMMIETKVLVA